MIAEPLFLLLEQQIMMDGFLEHIFVLRMGFFVAFHILDLVVPIAK